MMIFLICDIMFRLDVKEFSEHLDVARKFGMDIDPRVRNVYVNIV